MEDLFIFAFIAIGALPFFAIPATWIFGLRPFVAKHGRARITAVNWLLSMWADWTTAREIEKKTGKRTWSTRLFFGLWVYVVLLYGGGFALTYLLK
jgi:hypothetical protein